MKRTSALVLLSLLIFAAQAMAMDPNPNLKQLEAFARDYDCTGIAYASPMAPEHATSAVVTGAWALDGHWVRFSYTEKKTQQNPMPFAVAGSMGYDPQSKKLVIGAVDNMGGYASGSSAGWDGDTLVFTGPWHMGMQTLNARDTFMKTADGGLTHMGEIEMDGKWVKTGQETCTRRK